MPDNQKVALHIHVYYPDLLSEIVTRFSFIKIQPDIFISINSEDVRDEVNNALNNYSGRIVEIQCVPNRGRDLGPFFTVFGESLLNNYDFVGHIHTKKSNHDKDADYGNLWFQFLLINLLGDNSNAMADHILTKLYQDPTIGMVFPDDANIFGWTANLATAEPLAKRLGLDKLPENFNFPMGSMFWARSSALAPLINLNFTWNDYPNEPVSYDGTMLHAVERLLSLSCSLNNLRYATTNVNGVTR